MRLWWKWSWIPPRWQQLRGLAVMLLGRWIDSDALARSGRRAALIGRVRAQYAYSAVDAAHAVDRWLERMSDGLDESLPGSARVVR